MVKRSGWMPMAALAVTIAVAGCGGSDAPRGVGRGQGSHASDPARDLATYADSMPADGSVAPEMIAEALRRLAGAAGNASAVPPEVAVDLRVNAEHVLLNPESTDVAGTVRDTLTRAAQAIGGSKAGLDQAATGIDASSPLTGQAAALRKYFQAAALALAAG